MTDLPVAPAAISRSFPERSRKLHTVVTTKWPDGDFNPYELQAVDGWHSIDRDGNWDASALCRDFSHCLVHSRHDDWADVDVAAEIRPTVLIFKPSSSLWISACIRADGVSWLRVCGSSMDAVRAEFESIRERYLKPHRLDSVGEFYIISTDGDGPTRYCVELSEGITRPEEIELHYGKDFAKWHKEFVELLQTRKGGLAILQGATGTGKTSYLRHLLYTLRKTHRFYYLPVSVFPVLASPTAVNFWSNENDLCAGRTKVVLIEDAESLLTVRDLTNQESLSNLLNIADGFLGEFLKLHIICTINAPVEKLDPAINRPGRLIAARTFRTLTPTEAHRIAQVKRLSLMQRDEYTLAEIYNGTAVRRDDHRDVAIGFGLNCAP